jgi:hypothetical protein
MKESKNKREKPATDVAARQRILSIAATPAGIPSNGPLLHQDPESSARQHEKQNKAVNA